MVRATVLLLYMKVGSGLTDLFLYSLVPTQKKGVVEKATSILIVP
jgi:hypothetical protein